MATPNCPSFKGPATPVALLQWLASCEDVFEATSYQNGRPVSNSLKVVAAGSSISDEAKDLFDWWKSKEVDLIQLSWEEFVDEMASRALGADWKTKALESFSHAEQSESTIEEYIAKLQDAQLVAKQAGFDISDTHYKSQLLFHASPAVSTLVQATPNFNIARLKNEELEELMRSVSKSASDDQEKRLEPSGSSSNVPLPPPPPPPAPHMLSETGQWELSEQWGREEARNVPFIQVDSSLPNPEKSGRVVSVSISFNGWLNGLKTVIHSDETNTTWTLDAHSAKSPPSFQDISFDAGDYINRVEFTRLPGNNPVTSVGIQTYRGKNWTVGKVEEETKVFQAKRGQRIVGFHGSYCWFDSFYIYKVGVIYGPLLPGEK